MEKIIPITGITIALIATIIIIIKDKYNKLYWLKYKIEKGIENIHEIFIKKYELNIKYINYIKEKVKINDDTFNNYQNINKEINVNEFNKIIEDMDNDIKEILDNNEKILKNKDIHDIQKEIYNENNTINGLKKYYNNNVNYYNKISNSFLTKIIKRLFKYPEYDCLSLENEEHFKILDE